MPEAPNTALRSIPAVEAVVRDTSLASLVAALPQPLVVEAVREILDEARARVRRTRVPVERPVLVEAARARLAPFLAGRPARVVNATGIILHTNLGRAVLGERVADRVREVARGYCDVEWDAASGERGRREDQVDLLLRALVQAEASLIVNNCAAAVLLLLDTFARGRDVIVSRGELVEIGGGFRIPDVLERSGARLVEVGTTNKTRVADFVGALSPDTAAFLRIHTSNFRLIGFTESPSTADLAAVAEEQGVLLLRDLGSGWPGALEGPVPPDEPTLAGEIAAGAHLVCASGDKLLGGPQAGIIVGKRALVRQAAQNPLYRALRPDKLTLAALAETLLVHLEGCASEELPAVRMLARSAEELASEAATLAAELSARLEAAAEVTTEAGESEMGGGSMPATPLPTTLVVLRPRHAAAHEVEASLRAARPPVLVRVRDRSLVIDPRTLLPGERPVLVDRLDAAFRARFA